jgi:hypothetical protein
MAFVVTSRFLKTTKFIIFSFIHDSFNFKFDVKINEELGQIEFLNFSMLSNAKGMSEAA